MSVDTLARETRPEELVYSAEDRDRDGRLRELDEDPCRFLGNPSSETYAVVPNGLLDLFLSRARRLADWLDDDDRSARVTLSFDDHDETSWPRRPARSPERGRSAHPAESSR